MSKVALIRGSIDDQGDITYQNGRPSAGGVVTTPGAIDRATLVCVETGGTATTWNVTVYGLPGTDFAGNPWVAGTPVVAHTDTEGSGVMASDQVVDHVLTGVYIVPTLTDLGTATGFDFELTILCH